jgi:hypothetical protein
MVVATIALGEKLMTADGTGIMYGVPPTVKEIEPVKPIVAGSDPSPWTFTTLVNQMKSPALIGVPLKFEVIDENPESVCADASGVTPAAESNPTPVLIPAVLRNRLRVESISDPPKRLMD